MKISIKIVLLLIPAVILLCPVHAQQRREARTKTWYTWVKLKDDPKILKGVLYEIKDSSILIVSPLFKYDSLVDGLNTKNISYSDIDILKTRRVKSIKDGALIGSAAGFTGGILLLSQEAGGLSDLGFFGGEIALFVGLSFAVFGGAAGALAGTVRDRFPIRNDLENLNKYKGWLQKYSYVKESTAKTNLFEHKGFIEFNFGPSFLTENLSLIPGNSDITHITGSGLYGNIYAGYRLNKNLGVFVLSPYADFPLESKWDTTRYWSLGGFVAGPLFSLPVRDKLLIDFRPGIGYVESYLYSGEEEIMAGKGLEIIINAALLYDFSKRWGLAAELGYSSTRQKYKDKSEGKFAFITPGLGLTYKFGRVSL